MRVLQWIVDRVNGKAAAVDSPFGSMPKYEDINWQGLDFDKATYEGLMTIVKQEGLAEVEEIKGHFDKFGDALPGEMEDERQAFGTRLSAGPDVWHLPS